MKYRKFSILLIPGLFSPIYSLNKIKDRIEKEGYSCFYPPFLVNTLVRGEKQALERTLNKIGRAILITHSAGGLLALRLATNERVLTIIGLDTPILGRIRLPIPYFEARSICGKFLPLVGPTEIKRFRTLHSLLPFNTKVQQWILDTLKQNGV